MSARLRVLISLVVLGVLTVGSGVALAAERPTATRQRAPAHHPQWTGCYAGPGVGTVPGRMAVAWRPAASGFPDASQRARLQANGSGRMDGPGFALGGQVGCHRRAGGFVWGAEVDAQRTNLDEARDTSVAVPGVGSGTEAYERAFGSDWTATFRGRAGWLIAPAVLVYGTGGVAVADADTADAVVVPGGSVNAVADSRTRAGWTVGGGVEWTIARPWSIRVGYLYADFGSFVTTSRSREPALAPAAIDHEHRLGEHLVVAAFNVHF